MDQGALQQKLKMVWEHVMHQIKRQIINHSLWMAMESTVPVAMEGNLMILAIAPGNFHLASHLEQAGARAQIEHLLQAQAGGAEIHYRVIEGETLDDWQEVKDREKAAKDMASAAPERPTSSSLATPNFKVSATWEEVVTHVHRAFTALHVKTAPQARAHYIRDMLPIIAEAEDTIHPEAERMSDDRALAHVFEKMAQLCECNPVTVALAYAEYREAHRSKSEN
jgi:hypothetical protein